MCPRWCGYISCPGVCCTHCIWGFLAATMSSLVLNCYPCSDHGKMAQARGVKLYTRSLFDPDPGLLAKNGGEATLLINCGQYSRACTTCWQNSCCHDEEGDNGVVSMCFNFFSFGSFFALPLSILLGLPGLIYTSFTSPGPRPAAFELMDGEDEL